MTMALWTAKATIMPKPGVNDPQGEAIRGGLASLQFDDVREVRAGKQIVISLEAGSRDEAIAAVERMCEHLLANPVIEVYSVTAETAHAAEVTA
jgi:phosphoribosylformylglycinamidine synthase subunit PurS